MGRFTARLSKRAHVQYYVVTDTKTKVTCTCSPRKLVDVIEALTTCVQRGYYSPSQYSFYCQEKIEKIFYKKDVYDSVARLVLIRKNRKKVTSNIRHEINVTAVNRILRDTGDTFGKNISE